MAQSFFQSIAAAPRVVLRIVMRRLALMFPPIRRIVEERDRYYRLTRELEVESRRLAAECRALTDCNVERGEEIQRLIAESSALLQSNRDLASDIENISAERDVLREERGGLVAENTGLRLALKQAKPSSKPPEALNRVEKSRPSVFFVSLPKSGTVYTWYCLQEMTGLKMPDFHSLEGWTDYNAGRDFSCPDLYACGDYNTQLLIPDGMRNFLHGFIFGSHMQASYHNIRVLKESGIEKITVLLRDPRDAFVSWVHHLRNLGPSARNYHSKIYHVPRAYYEWSPEEQLDYQIRTFLPITVNWVEGWLDYYASKDREIEVLFVYYDELKREPARYFRRIAEFHELNDVDYSKVVTPEPGKMHFRRGEHGQWQDEFSAANQKLAEDLMGDRILRGFHAAGRRHPGFIAAENYLRSGHGKAATTEALRAIIQFPNHRPSYELLFYAADICALNTAPLRALVDSDLRDLTVSGTFIYRYELVSACDKLIRGMRRPTCL